MDDEYILLHKKIEEISVDIEFLDTLELRRYNRFLNPNKKAEFLAGRCFLKEEISKMVKETPQEIIISISEKGKPFCSNPDMEYPYFSLSHSGEMIVIAFSKFPVGVDIEFQKDVTLDALLPFLSEKESDILNNQTRINQQENLLCLITMKEAFIKATDKKWGLDLISFMWIKKSWQLIKPKTYCSFIVERHKEYIISICFIKN